MLNAFAGSNDPMTFHRTISGGNCVTCQWIAAEGVIKADTHLQYLDFLRREGLEKTHGLNIHLNSRGGNLMGGVKLGIVIRKSGANTVVSGSAIKEIYDDGTRLVDFGKVIQSECSSACVFAFFGGISRYASYNSPSYKIGFQNIGRLGVHQFYDKVSIAKPNALQLTAEDRIKDQKIIAVLLGFLSEMGVSSEILRIGSRTHPKKIHYLTEDELLKTRADNRMVKKVLLRGYRNGVAITEVNFKRHDSNYKLELYCDRGKLMMLATIVWRDIYDVPGHEEWHIYDSLSLKDGDKVILISEEFNQRSDGGTTGKLLFRFKETISNLIKRKQFQFEDFSSRYASNKAYDLSFHLPSDFNGLFILPKACH